jgi:antagonist of KipI
MDRFALAAANLLVGNPEGAPVLECALAGPVLVAMRSCVVAITGADFGPELNGCPIPNWTGVFLAEGDRLALTTRRWGARAYVAVAGGLVGERWLGSVSTYPLVNKGGLHGRSLKAGDVLVATLQSRPAVVGRELPKTARPPYSDGPVLAAVPGPHFHLLSDPTRAQLLSAPWTVSRDADRMGYRLEGPELSIDGGEEMVSFGLTVGCVQVPPSGRPILLMADHQTAGGYPVVLGVARADLPMAAQLLPGDRLWFREVTVEEAQEAWRRRWATLDVLRAP